MDAPFACVVKFWVSPEGSETVHALRKLDSKRRRPEVVAQPGFQSARRVRLEESPTTAGRPT